MEERVIQTLNSIEEIKNKTLIIKNYIMIVEIFLTIIIFLPLYLRQFGWVEISLLFWWEIKKQIVILYY